MGPDTRDVLADAAALAGLVTVLVALVLVVVLAMRATTVLSQQAEARPSFDDRWFAVRQAAYFCLALLLVGAALVAVPELASEGEPSPSPSVEASQPKAPESEAPESEPPESQMPESAPPESAPASEEGAGGRDG